jgi:predicted methyltransferase
LRFLNNIGLFNKYLSRIGVRTSSVEIAVLVLDTLGKYAENEGFIKIEEDIVRLTEKGLDECQKLSRDWD